MAPSKKPRASYKRKQFDVFGKKLLEQKLLVGEGSDRSQVNTQSRSSKDPRGLPPGSVMSLDLELKKEDVDSAERLRGFYRRDKVTKRDRDVLYPLTTLRKDDRDRFKQSISYKGRTHTPSRSEPRKRAEFEKAVAKFLGERGYDPEGEPRLSNPLGANRKKADRKDNLILLAGLLGIGATALGTRKLKRAVRYKTLRRTLDRKPLTRGAIVNYNNPPGVGSSSSNSAADAIAKELKSLLPRNKRSRTGAILRERINRIAGSR